jgi:hypothetical protein
MEITFTSEARKSQLDETFMEITINTPALLFPAITLLMLAYTNRFLAVASLIRKLHAHYKETSLEDQAAVKQQIVSLRRRLILVKQMQAGGILSFFLSALAMLFISLELSVLAHSAFALSLIILLFSLALCLNEIYISTRALEIELKDMED